MANIQLEDIKYCRGYLLCEASNPYVPDRFQKISLPGGYNFFHDIILSVNFAVSDSSDAWVLLAGNAIDVDSGESAISLIAQRLLLNLQKGDTAFFDYLDNLSGRFVIIYRLHGRIKILNDAGGLRSVFYYSGDNPIVASHPGLIQSMINSSPTEIAMLSLTNEAVRLLAGLPGRETAYRDVYILTPNTQLDLNSGNIKRYFPRNDNTENDVEEAASIVIDSAQKQLKALSEKGEKMLLSITAGIDSRMTLALSKPYSSLIEYFTYRRHNNETHNMDAAVATQIAKKCHVDHSLLNVPPDLHTTKEYLEFEKELGKNAWRSHGRTIAFLYWKKFGGSESIHIRSSLAEIGRASLQKKGKKGHLRASDLVKLKNSSLYQQKEVERAFTDFYEVTEFEKLHNYDPYDMFYWEHRMGTWHSNVVVESDPAFETNILFNNRKILKAMMSVSFEERRTGAVFKYVIRELWPELCDFEINPANWKELYGESKE